MKKDKRDDLIILCDQLESCNKKLCKRNEIVCAKNKIRQYVGNDINKKHQLRALVDIHDEGNKMGFFNYLSVLISVFSFGAVIISNIAGKESIDYLFYILISLIVIVVICFIENLFSKRTNARKKWIRYIKIALENITEK